MIVNERNYLFDNAKVILIFLVVFGHSLERYIDNNSALRCVYSLIFLFHMPLFVFISGYFSKNIEKCRKNAVNDLLVPFLVFNSIWYISNGNLSFPLYYAGWTLWYLLSLFFWRFFLKDILKIKWAFLGSVIFGVLIGALDKYSSLLSISRTFAFFPFFLLGYYSNEKTIEKINSIPKVISYVGLLSIGVGVYFVSNMNVISYKFLYMSQSYESFGLNLAYGAVLRLSMYLVAIVLSVFVMNIISKDKIFLSRFGASTLMIYLGHIYMLRVLNKIMPEINSQYIIFGVMFLASYLICMALSNPIILNAYELFFNKITRITQALKSS